jgi:hypothetical protein
MYRLPSSKAIQPVTFGAGSSDAQSISWRDPNGPGRSRAKFYSSCRGTLQIQHRPVIRGEGPSSW